MITGILKITVDSPFLVCYNKSITKEADMKAKIRRFKMESESGTLNVNVRQGCFGMWVSVSQEVKAPLTHHSIRPVQWVPNAQSLEGVL